MNPETAGTNYEINLRLLPSTDIRKIIDTIAPYCTELDRDNEFQPCITINARINETILEKLSATPGATRSPYYIPATKYENRPIPYEALLRATQMVATCFKTEHEGEQWSALDIPKIESNCRHRLFCMLAQDWIKEHIVYPNNPTIKPPEIKEETWQEYLQRWDIQPEQIMRIVD